MGMTGSDDNDEEQHLPKGVEEWEAMSEKLLLGVVFVADEISDACEQEQEEEAGDRHLLMLSLFLDSLELARQDATILSKPRSKNQSDLSRSLSPSLALSLSPARSSSL